MKEILLLQKKYKHTVYPDGEILKYKFFDNMEELNSFMKDNCLNPNLNNGVFHKIIDFSKLNKFKNVNK